MYQAKNRMKETTSELHKTYTVDIRIKRHRTFSFPFRVWFPQPHLSGSRSCSKFELQVNMFSPIPKAHIYGLFWRTMNTEKQSWLKAKNQFRQDRST